MGWHLHLIIQQTFLKENFNSGSSIIGSQFYVAWEQNAVVASECSGGGGNLYLSAQKSSRISSTFFLELDKYVRLKPLEAQMTTDLCLPEFLQFTLI